MWIIFLIFSTKKEIETHPKYQTPIEPVDFELTYHVTLVNYNFSQLFVFFDNYLIPTTTLVNYLFFDKKSTITSSTIAMVEKVLNHVGIHGGATSI